MKNMTTLLVKTIPMRSLTPVALGSLCKLCIRLGWKFSSAPSDPTVLEVKLPAEDDNLWDFLMDGLE